MSYVVVMIFLLGTLLSIKGYSEISPWWTHFTYMMSHQNFFHFLVNSVAFFMLAKLLQAIYNKWWLLLASVSVAFIMSFFAMFPAETIGGSGMVYALMGIFSSLVFAQKIRFKSSWYLGVFIFGVALGFGVSFMKESSNTMLHALCYLGGFTAGLVKLMFKK